MLWRLFTLSQRFVSISVVGVIVLAAAPDDLLNGPREGGVEVVLAMARTFPLHWHFVCRLRLGGQPRAACSTTPLLRPPSPTHRSPCDGQAAANFPWCDTTKSIDARVASLVSGLTDVSDPFFQKINPMASSCWPSSQACAWVGVRETRRWAILPV